MGVGAQASENGGHAGGHGGFSGSLLVVLPDGCTTAVL